MAGMVILGALAAFGAVCALWILAGALLPGDREGIVLYVWRDSAAGRGFAARWRIQWELGLLRGRLLVVNLALTEDDRRFLARWGRDMEILDTERENGTGTGNHPGRDQRRGLSEL